MTRRALAHGALDRIEARDVKRRAGRPPAEFFCRDEGRVEELCAAGFVAQVFPAGLIEQVEQLTGGES